MLHLFVLLDIVISTSAFVKTFTRFQRVAKSSIKFKLASKLASKIFLPVVFITSIQTVNAAETVESYIPYQTADEALADNTALPPMGKHALNFLG